MLNTITKILFNILLYPFKLFSKLFFGILKRFKFSMAFKISVSYFLLYVIVIFIVAVTTSTGYFIYEINKYNDDVMISYMNNISNDFPDLNNKNRITDDGQISSLNIYDDSLDLVYSEGIEVDKPYSDSIISIIENIIYKREYIYSSSFSHDSSEYYVNIYYSVKYILSNTKRIDGLICISGAVGLLLFTPIVSRTSYKLTGPIKNMTETTKTITVNNINTRLDIKGAQDELKELSQTFNEMMERIEEGYKSQQQFVSDASHELRTPIAVIKGYVNMLDRWGKNDKAILEESISAIKNEAENMQDLIEKLLFIARSDKHTLTFNKEDFRICEILFEIEKETKMIDFKHRLFFKFYDDASIYADKNRIKQAIRILLDNAMKFTSAEGYIMLSGYIQEDYYIIKVEDTGVGIAKKDLGKIFDRLYRAEQSRNKEIGGHGLGLSIAKIIILGHKGKIKVKSKFGSGSQFSIMLPYLDKV